MSFHKSVLHSLKTPQDSSLHFSPYLKEKISLFIQFERKLSSFRWSGFKFTDYHIALQNLAYLQIKVSLVNNYHIYRPMYWWVLKGFIFWQRKFLKLYTNNTDFFSFRWMCQWCHQYSNKLTVYFSHSHTFHEWRRSVGVG